MRTITLDTVELSEAATRGTEAPSVPHPTRFRRLILRLRTPTRAQRLREWRRILDTIAPVDVHRARTTPGITAIERFALTEAWR